MLHLVGSFIYELYYDAQIHEHQTKVYSALLTLP